LGSNGVVSIYCPETVPCIAFELSKILVSEEEMTVIKKLSGLSRIKEND